MGNPRGAIIPSMNLVKKERVGMFVGACLISAVLLLSITTFVECVSSKQVAAPLPPPPPPPTFPPPTPHTAGPMGSRMDRESTQQIEKYARSRPVDFSRFQDNYEERMGNPPSDKGYESLDERWFQRFALARTTLHRRAMNTSRVRLQMSQHYIPANLRKIPVLGVTVYRDDNTTRYVDRLLQSIDTPVGTLVITWFGNFSREAHTVIRALVNGGYDNIICDELVINQYPLNLGFSFGVNEVIYQNMNAPWWLCASHDVAYPPGVLGNIAESVNTHIIAGNGGLHWFGFVDDQYQPWSNFVVTAQAVAKIGIFDENFFPCYSEDVEFGGRAKWHQVKQIVEKDGPYQIIHGWVDKRRHQSATIEDLLKSKTSIAMWSALAESGNNPVYEKCKKGALTGKAFDSYSDPYKWELDYRRRICQMKAAMDSLRGKKPKQGTCLPELCRK
mmetsp:Transcript_6183/g.8594  ORF Transcript_6183/g.8594 Transcript_6183/m.8594 type:complete len:445 (+) Transcript_6183:468-1802(+)|eukprot:CAMPEP_0185252176 /NCGR_PEP_ID=MMETSP1359-20130426/1360_1 /TAXON_ID=552665 /ORGANISM="Bigelowiella longifila, Strain CCMP242" /LENGTH=444 /DNA_ID=CAMNT_0027834291 /DNA_START=496 /DNA_END=1830 /DNA_ORIENTATION=-